MTQADRNDLDVGAWFRVLARFWWVVVGLVVLGILAGALFTAAQPNEYSATSSVYIGQTTDANGNAMAGLNSNAKAAVQLLASQVVLDEAAKRTGMGMTPAKLRRSTTVETPSQTVKTTTSVVNIVVITVTDTNKARATKAANALADVLLERIGTGVEKKIVILQQQLDEGQAAYKASVARSDAAQRALERLKGADSAATASYVAIVQAAATEQEALAGSNQQTELLLLTAKQVEEPRLLHEAAVPDSPSGPDMTLNVAAGALAGLVIGIVAAFVLARLRPAPPAA